MSGRHDDRNSAHAAPGGNGTARLAAWLASATESAGPTGVDPSLVAQAAVDVILNVASHVAHDVARPAAPLATFALGFQLGRYDARLSDLEEHAVRIVERASEWRASDADLSALSPTIEATTQQRDLLPQGEL